MATLILKGKNRQVVSGADLYDARELSVIVDQWDGPKSAVNITSSPRGAVVLGGESIGSARNATMARQTLYKRGPDGSGNGAGVRMEGSFGVTIRRHYSDYAWDPLKFAEGSDAWTAEECWIKHARDDAVENDPVVGQNGRVIRCFFEDFHSLLSITPGAGAAVKNPCTVVYQDCLMSSANILKGGASAWDDRDDKTYAWGDPVAGGSQIFKVRGVQGNKVTGGGAGLTIEMHGCHMAVRRRINTAKANLRLFQDMKVRGAGNVFYYLTDFKGLTKVRWKGGDVPAEFELDKWPDLWDRVSNDPAEWEAVRQRWIARVWQGDDPMPDPEPDPDPVPDPEPDPVPEPDPDPVPDPEPTPHDCTAEIAAAVAPLERELAAVGVDRATLRKALELIHGMAAEALSDGGEAG